jgi:hypothetical protein
VRAQALRVAEHTSFLFTALMPRLSIRAAMLAVLLPLFAAFAQTPAPTDTRLLRFPTTNGQQIVFTYAGQLYTVNRDGGIARRLTSGPGYTSFPRFSPDGTQLAYTSHYEGNTEVYVMPGEGGAPKRLTTTATLGRDDISDRMGPNNIVMTWQNTKPQVVFRSRMRSYNAFNGQLFAVGLDAELPQPLPFPRAGFASFSPDDSKLAFNRVFANSEPGSITAAAWPMTSGSTTSRAARREPDQQPGPGYLPDVGAGQPHLLHLGSRRPHEPLLDRPRVERDQAADHLQRLRHQVPVHREGRDRLRASRANLALRSRERSGRARADLHQGRLRLGRAGLVDAGKHVQSVADGSGRQARHRRSPRRALFCAGERWHAA